MDTDSDRRRCRPACEGLEDRALQAVVLIFNGNAFGPTSPSALTRQLAAELRADGHQAVEVSLGTVTPAVLVQLGRKVDALAKRHGPVGLAGLSAGGTLAARLALTNPNVAAALDCYGPLDLADWYAYQKAQGTPFARACLAVVNGYVRDPRTIDRLSGPGRLPRTPIIAAFGDRDINVSYDVNRRSAAKLHANIQLVRYAGGHGVPAPAAAVDLFLEALDARSPAGRSTLAALR